VLKIAKNSLTIGQTLVERLLAAALLATDSRSRLSVTCKAG
jgi:hypothetical protein